jgi:biopolymer transport protein ExbB
VEGALFAAQERRARLYRELREASAEQQAWETGDGRSDRGMRGRIEAQRREAARLERDLAAGMTAFKELTTDVETISYEVKSKSILLTAVARDISRQAAELVDRLRGTLLGMEKPNLITRALALAKAEPTKDADILGARLTQLQTLYLETLDDLSRVGVFEMEISEAGAGGAVNSRTVLRIGDMTGFYASPEGGGYVLRKTTTADDSDAGFLGEARGLSDDQRHAINAFVAAPGEPHLVPYDVTDGRGIAVARSTRTFRQWFASGGVFMIPLAVLVGILACVILWRTVVLLWRTAFQDRNCRTILGLVGLGRTEEARAFTRGLSGPEGRLMTVGFDFRTADRDTLEDAFSEAMLLTQPSFQRGLSLIALGAAIAPMIGLLGTVTGMITTFKSLVIFGASDPANLAGGISEALITTQAGLLVAVPALLVRGVLGALSENALARLEGRAMSLVIALRRDTPPEGGDDAGPHAPPQDGESAEPQTHPEDGHTPKPELNLSPEEALKA